MNIGNNIRFYRRKRGLSQKELANEIFVTERTLSNYESGSRIPTVDMLNLIAKSLSIFAKDLISSIPLQDRLFFPEDFLYFDWNSETKTYNLLPLNTTGHSIDNQYVVTEMFDKIVCFSTRDVIRISSDFPSLKNELTNVDFLSLHKKCTNSMFILIRDEKEEYTAVGIDTAIEVSSFSTFFPPKESLHSYLDSFLYSLLCIRSSLLYTNSMQPTDSILTFSSEMDELYQLIKKNSAISIVQSKIRYLQYLYSQFDEEEFHTFKEEHEKNLHMFHTVNGNDKELMEKIDEYVIPITDTPHYLLQLNEKTKEYELL